MRLDSDVVYFGESGERYLNGRADSLKVTDSVNMVSAYERII